MNFEMEYRRLGKSGLKVSVFSFGSWVTFSNQLNEKAATELMEYAYDNGINFFDNAEIYANGNSEIIMGKILKKTGWSRDTYILSSKVFWGGEKPTQIGLSRKHITDGCHAALKRLQVEYIDLFFCHRPDPETPIEETVRAMDVLIQQGKVLYWGTSEWEAEQITEAYEIAEKFNLTPPTMEQPEYNLFNRGKIEKDYLPLYKKYGLGTTIWSPLASGLLTGKYNHGIPSNSRAYVKGYEWLKEQFESEETIQKIGKVKELQPIAERLEISLTQLALGYCLKNPNVSTIILGASKKEQLKENLGTLSIMDKITDSTIKDINKVLDK
jgi:voltage-dependent potassium channel beta subunit|tara:strand:+ start:79 stop:1056 length:978 start_codon:yes stop_codon:yes gene_type:complete